MRWRDKAPTEAELLDSRIIGWLIRDDRGRTYVATRTDTGWKCTDGSGYTGAFAYESLLRMFLGEQLQLRRQFCPLLEPQVSRPKRGKKS